MFKVGDLVKLDTDKFYTTFFDMLIGSRTDRDKWLRNWIREFKKKTNKTCVVRVKFISEGSRNMDVATLDDSDVWFLYKDLFTLYQDPVFCNLHYHVK